MFSGNLPMPFSKNFFHLKEKIDELKTQKLEQWKVKVSNNYIWNKTEKQNIETDSFWRKKKTIIILNFIIISKQWLTAAIGFNVLSKK